MPRSENVRGDINDVIRVARQGLNRSNASRIISKQECMVELTGLPLVLCSEDIENINISGAMKCQRQDNYGQDRSVIRRYQTRPMDNETLTFCEFIHKENKAKQGTKTIIPHFIGMTSTPTYPPTASYARATLIIHTHWRNAEIHKLSDSECLKRFDTCIRTKLLPASVILNYNKMKSQYDEHRMYVEPTQKEEVYHDDKEEIGTEDLMLIRVMNSFSTSASTNVKINGTEYNRGLTYDWSNGGQNVSAKTYIMYKINFCTTNKLFPQGSIFERKQSSLVRTYNT